MPTYSYACTACDHHFDIHQAFTDDALTVCPQCEGTLRKLFSAVGVVFKGSGFYRTDSRNGSTSGASGKSSSTSTSGAGGSASSSGSGTSSSGGSGSASSDGSSAGSSNGSSSKAPATSGASGSA